MTFPTMLCCGYAGFLAVCAGALAVAARPNARQGHAEAPFSVTGTAELRRGLSRLLSVLAGAFVGVAAIRVHAVTDAAAVAMTAVVAVTLGAFAWRPRASGGASGSGPS